MEKLSEGKSEFLSEALQLDTIYPSISFRINEALLNQDLRNQN